MPERKTSRGDLTGAVKSPATRALQPVIWVVQRLLQGGEQRREIKDFHTCCENGLEVPEDQRISVTVTVLVMAPEAAGRDSKRR